MNTTASSNQRSAIGKLLDILTQYGTLPDTPHPDLLTNAQAELAGMEILIDLQAAELVRLRRIEAELERLRHIKAYARQLLDTFDEFGNFNCSSEYIDALAAALEWKPQ